MNDVTISGNSITNSDGVGIQLSVYTGATTVISGVTLRGNTVTGSVTDGLQIVSTGGGVFSNINFGDASLGTGGSNSIYSNDTGGGGADYDIQNDSGINSLKAENNYWGGGAGSFGGANSVDGVPFLTTDPNA